MFPTRRRTRTLIACCSLAALSLLSACGSTSSAGSSSGSAGEGASTSAAAPGPSALASADGPVTVTLWHGLGGTGGTALTSAIDAFNQANAGKIKVQAVFQGNYADTIAKYTSALRDKSTPSILVTNDVTTGFVQDAGQTVSPEALAAANPKDLKLTSLRPAARNYYSADGHLLAVPLATSMPLLYVNDDLLAKAGVDRSTLGTLAGVAAAARAVTAAEPGVKGIVQPFDGWWFEQLTAASGQLYCTPGNGRTGDGATALTLTSPAQKKAISTMASLYTDGVGLDTGTDGNVALTAFAAGKVAMMFNSSGAIGGLAADKMTGYTALPYPISGPKASSGALIGGAAMWVSGPGHSAAEQVASWKVVSYLASAAVQERFSQASGYAPVVSAVDDTPSEKAYLAANPPFQTLATQFATTPATPATSGCLTGAMTGIRSAVVTQMQSAFAGTTGLDDALTAAQKAGDQAISDYREQAGK